MFRIEPFTAGSPTFDAAAWVYMRVWGNEWEASRQFFHHYATTMPDHLGFVAVATAPPPRRWWPRRLPPMGVVGFGFGVRSVPGQWWHDRVAAHVGPDNPALQEAWVLVELAVLPGWRGHGIGAALQDRLIAAQPCPRLLLSTMASNTRAQRFYARHGWQLLHPGFPFERGRPHYAIMHRNKDLTA